MKPILLTLFLLLTSILLHADPITREAARLQAVQFVQRGWRTVEGTNTAARRRSPAKVELHDAAYSDNSLYIFNIGTNDGFVIVSTDDCTDPILAYSDTGTFDEKDLPENAKAWMKNAYSLPLPPPKGGGDHTLNSPSFRRGQGEAESCSIRPLLPTLWSQRSPYNLLCPNDNATGCVATAMAQVMRYYEWPQEETTAIPVYADYEGLPTTKFDWNLMLNGYGGMETEEEMMAVAKLMQYCGWAVEMNYSSTSSAYERMIPIALRQYFGYDAGVRVVNRTDYSIAQWDSIIYSELAAGRPVIYSGQKSGGGHEFVCDGYDGQGFYHINWGWGGSSNGYYRLSVLTPPTIGTGGGSSKGGFNMYQCAVIGIQPDRGGSTAADEMLLTSEELHVLAQTKVKRASVTEKFELKLRNALGNHTTEASKFRYGLGLMQSNGSLAQTYSQSIMPFNPGSYSGRTGSVNYSFGARLTGTYRIVPICSVGSGTAKWQPVLGSDRNYIEAELTDTTLTLTEHPIRGIKVDSVTFAPTIDGVIEVKAFATNHGEEYNGTLCLRVNGLEKQTIGVAIAAGDSEVITFQYTPWSGTQKYQIGYSNDESLWLSEGAVDYMDVTKLNSFNVWDCQGNISTALLDENNRAIVPENAVAADLRNVTPTAVIPNNNPNTLYYVADSYATENIPGATNIILGTFAPCFTLIDGHDFFCPIPFTAGQATYTRTFPHGYDGNGGWDTIILPFTVENVQLCEKTALDLPSSAKGDSLLSTLHSSLNWFLSPDDTDKQFWLMEYSGSAPDDLTFTHATLFQANRPYLIAVPGPVYGKLSLTGVPITFSAAHAVVESTALTTEHRDVYTLVGTYATVVESRQFQLNEQGSQFFLNDQPIPPFRAYMLPQSSLTKTR